MLKKIFGLFTSTPKPRTDYTREELLTLTKDWRNFHSIFPTAELESLCEVSKNLLSELDVNDENFDNKYDQIMLGYLVISMAFEGSNYPGTKPAYPLNYRELLKATEITPSSKVFFDFDFQTSTYTPKTTPRDNKSLILSVGQKILDKSLPFDASCIDQMSMNLKNILAIRDRFEKYTTTAELSNEKSVVVR